MYKGAYDVASKCLRDLAAVAPPPPIPDSELTVAQLGPEWDDAKIQLDFLPHTVEGWKSGGANIWQKLTDQGFVAAANEVIAMFLPPGEYKPASTPIHFAEGG